MCAITNHHLLRADLCRSRCARELILIRNGRANLPWFTSKWSLFITHSEVVVSRVFFSAAPTSLLFWENDSQGKVRGTIKLKELWCSKGQGSSYLAFHPRPQLVTCESCSICVVSRDDRGWIFWHFSGSAWHLSLLFILSLCTYFQKWCFFRQKGLCLVLISLTAACLCFMDFWQLL